MLVLPHMGLVKWNEVNDHFSHEQLAANFAALDGHDHTAGKGVKIPYGGLENLSVGPENLREGVFIASKLGAESIETSKLKNGAVTRGKLSTELLQTKRVAASASKSETLSITITWTAAFIDTSYTVSVTPDESATKHAGNLAEFKIVEKTNTKVVVEVAVVTSSPMTILIHAIAIHD